MARAGKTNGRLKEFAWAVLAHGVALLVGGFLGALFEGTFHKLAPILPWSPGSAVVDPRHAENGNPVGPGKITRLTLKRASETVVDDTKPGEGYRFCSLPPGNYEVDLYADDILAKQESFTVAKGSTIPVRVEIPREATILVRVLGADGKPADGTVVQIYSPLGNPLRGEAIVAHDTVASDGRTKMAGTTGVLYLQPTTASSGDYKVRVSKQGQELEARALRVFSGENPPMEFRLSPPAQGH